MIALKQLTHENIRSCLALDAGCDRKNFVANSFAIAWLYRDSAQPWIICRDDEPVGFILLVINAEVCSINRFMIDVNHQRQGYAKAALFAAFNHAMQAGCKSARLTVSPENEAAKSLYEGVGFVANGEMEHGEAVMTLELGARSK